MNMKKNLKLIIIMIIGILFIIAGIILLVLFRNKYIGTWKNTVLYDNTEIRSILKIKSNGTVLLKKENVKKSKDYSREGTWRKEDDKIIVSFKQGETIEDYTIHLINNNEILLGKDNWENNLFIYQRKSILTHEKKKSYLNIDKAKLEVDWQNIITDVTEISDINYENTMTLNEKDEKEDKLIVYLFVGEGCARCEDAKNYFQNLDEKYRLKIITEEFEIWNHTKTAQFLYNVSHSRGDKLLGLPYIIIGDKSWVGYDKSYNKEIKEQINMNTENTENIGNTENTENTENIQNNEDGQ